MPIQQPFSQDQEHATTSQDDFDLDIRVTDIASSPNSSANPNTITTWTYDPPYLSYCIECL